jgi:hypothetical protein
LKIKIASLKDVYKESKMIAFPFNDANSLLEKYNVYIREKIYINNMYLWFSSKEVRNNAKRGNSLVTWDIYNKPMNQYI